MSAEQPDGVSDAITRETQMMMMAGSQIGQRFAQRAAERRRQMAEQQHQVRQDLQARWDAQRQSARRQLADTDTDRFWSRATPEDVAQRYAVAQQWADHDDLAYRTVGSLTEQIEQRYGLSPQQYIDERTQAGRERRDSETLERIRDSGTAQWWDRADPQAVATAYRDAVARADDENYAHREDAAAARDRIAEGLQAHTGIESTDDLMAVSDQQAEAERQADLADLDSEQWWDQASGPQIAERFATVQGLDDADRRSDLDHQMRRELGERFDVYPDTGAGELSARHVLDIDDAQMPAEARGLDRPSETLAMIAAAHAADRGAQGMPMATVDEHAQVQNVSANSVDGLMEQLRATVDNSPEGRDGINARRIAEIGHGAEPDEAVTNAHSPTRARASRGMGQGRDQGQQLGL